MSADVTYTIRGFFPMKMVSFASGLISALMVSRGYDRIIKVSLVLGTRQSNSQPIMCKILRQDIQYDLMLI